MDSVQKISIVNLLSAFSRFLIFPFYILDWKNKEILYATGNPYFIGEYTADDLKSEGLDLLFRICRPEESGFLHKILVETAGFFSRLEDENKSDYVASYNYSIRIKDDFYVKVNNQVIMLGSGPDEEILLCMLFPYINKQGDDLVIENDKLNKKWIFNSSLGQWEKYSGYILTEKERLVMNYAVNGLDVRQTAALMNKSVETVKDYRKSVIEKLGVKSISEAISVVMVHRML